MKVINFLYLVMFVMLLLCIVNYILFSYGVDIKKEVMYYLQGVFNGLSSK